MTGGWLVDRTKMNLRHNLETAKYVYRSIARVCTKVDDTERTRYNQSNRPDIAHTLLLRRLPQATFVARSHFNLHTSHIPDEQSWYPLTFW